MSDTDGMLAQLITERDGATGEWWPSRPQMPELADIEDVIRQARNRGGWRNIRHMPKPSGPAKERAL